MAREATGWSTQLARQTGEHLVAAELGRLGYVAAPYAGNVPMFDILAADVRGYSVPIQVKTIKQPSWQLDAKNFLEIEIVNDIQRVIGKKPLLNPKVLYVFVLLKDNESRAVDEFYIIRVGDLQDLIERGYVNYLNQCGGRRPKKPDSTHTALRPEHLERFHKRWELLRDSFPPAVSIDERLDTPVKQSELFSGPHTADSSVSENRPNS